MSLRSKREVLRWSFVSIVLLIFTLTMASIAYADTLYWTPKAPMPTARSHAIAITVNGKIYVIGGATGATFPPSGVNNIVEMYDPATDTWQSKSPLSVNRFASGAVSDGSNIYIVGGSTGGPGLVNTVLSYDPVGGSTTVLAGPLNAPRFRCSAVIIGTKIYVIGGATSGGPPGYATPASTVEVYDLNRPGGPGVINTIAMPGPRDMPVAVANGTDIYVIGGFDGTHDNACTNCWKLDTNTNTWSVRQDIPYGIGRAGYKGALLSDGKILVPGGMTTRSWPPSVPDNPTSWIFDPVGNSWTPGPGIPEAMMSPAPAVIGDNVYVIGGVSGGQVTNTNRCASLQATLADYIAPVSGPGVSMVNCGGNPVSLTFPAGSSVGTLVVSKLNSGPAPLGLTTTGNYYDIATSANFSGSLTVTLPYDPAVSNPSLLKLYHWNGNSWQNVTASIDTIGHTITGNVTSLSPFVVAISSSSSVPASSTWSLALMGLVGVIIIVRILNRRKATSA